MAGDSIEEAHKKAAGTAIASGAVGLALSKLMPGRAQALNNPATKKAFSSAVKSFAKGGAEEISQGAIEEGFTHIASEMNKGKTFNEAATSFAEQFPQSALTSALLGGGVQAMADKKNASAQPQQPATNQQTPPPGHVAPSTQPDGKQSFSTVDAEGREISPSDTPEPTTIAPAVVPRPAAAGESSSGPQIPQSTTPSGPAPGKEAPATTPDSQTPPKPGSAPSAQAVIPENTTPSPADAPPGMQPSKEAASAGPVMTLDNAPQMLGDIERLKAKEKNGGLSKDEQISLHHAENLLARAQVTNLETKQKALSKLPTPRDLHSTELEALAKAKAMLARPWPGTAPASTTQSSSGSLPPGDTSTTQGVTPPAGIATSGHSGTGDTSGTTATGSATSTASSGGTITPSTGSESGTHTTNGVTAPPVGHGNLIPEDTTHAGHIDLANRRTENLEKIARKRPLNPHEQEVYDNARRVRDRNSPATPGSRNTGNPDDLAMSGDEDALVPVTPDGEDATLDAAADSPPASPPAQPANAVGTTISRPGAANPDTPMASAGSSTPPPNAPPPNAPPPNAPPPNAPPPNAPPPNVPPPNVPPPNVPPPNVPPPNAAAYPPIDHDHIIKADFNKDGAPTGGHSLVNNDVRIIPGTASRTNPQGVYEARVEMQNASGGWQAKLSNNGWNTMFPQNWSEHQIKTEVEAAWNSSMKTISPNGKKWRSVTPSGVVVEGYINPHTPNKPGRITAYPIY